MQFSVKECHKVMFCDIAMPSSVEGETMQSFAEGIRMQSLVEGHHDVFLLLKNKQCTYL